MPEHRFAIRLSTKGEHSAHSYQHACAHFTGQSGCSIYAVWVPCCTNGVTFCLLCHSLLFMEITCVKHLWCKCRKHKEIQRCALQDTVEDTIELKTDALHFFELYNHFDVRTGTQPSIRVMCIDKRAWLSLALCEGCSHGGTLELALSWMGRVVEN